MLLPEFILDALPEDSASGIRIFCEKKQIFRDVDLAQDARVMDQRAHPGLRPFAEVVHDQRTAEKVDGVMLLVPAEELCEDQLQHEQQKQGGKDAPEHAEHRPLVLFFEISLHQLLEKKGMICEVS